jgi:GNAT superfamily N-acetyltransferase
VERTRFVVDPIRAWSEADLRAFIANRVRTALRDTPQTEVLAEWEGAQMRGWAILHHQGEEWASGRPRTLIVPPTRASSPALLEEAVARARARGSQIVSADVAANDPELNRCFLEAGFVPEMHRIIMRLDPEEAAKRAAHLPKRAVERAARGYRVRRADPSDSLTLIFLATACVPMMFHEQRAGDMDHIQMRFLELYGDLDLSEDSAYHVWICETVEGDLAGAILIDPFHTEVVDGSWQAHVMDISVLPEHWGRAVGVFLGARGVEGLEAEGIQYVSGNIGTHNERVLSLASRFGFVVEQTQYVRLLYREEPSLG